MDLTNKTKCNHDVATRDNSIVTVYTGSVPSIVTGATFEGSGDGFYTYTSPDAANEHQIRIYPFIIVDGVRYYSPTYAESATMYVSGSSLEYIVNWSWSSVVCDGYRILLRAVTPQTTPNFDFYQDVYAVSLADYSDAWVSGNTVTPTTRGTYTTPYTVCPRCLGQVSLDGTNVIEPSKNYYGGIDFGADGNITTVTNGSQLKQQIEKILKENIRSTGYGFDYSILPSVIDATLLGRIRTEVVRCLSYLRFVQQSDKAAGTKFNPQEELESIVSLDVSQNSSDPRSVIVDVVVRAASSTPVSTTVVIRR